EILVVQFDAPRHAVQPHLQARVLVADRGADRRTRGADPLTRLVAISRFTPRRRVVQQLVQRTKRPKTNPRTRRRQLHTHYPAQTPPLTKRLPTNNPLPNKQATTQQTRPLLETSAGGYSGGIGKPGR